MGDDFPAESAVERDGVREQHPEGLFALPHVYQRLVHQALHDAVPGVFRVGADAGDEPDGVHRVVDIRLQGVDGNLRNEGFAVKTAQYVRALEHGALGLLDFLVLPTGVEQLLLCHLKGITKQGVVLVKVVGRQRSYLIALRQIHALFHVGKHLLRYTEIVTRNAGEVKGKSAAGLFQNAKVAQMRFLCYNKMSTECSLADIPRSDTLRIYRGAQAAPF